MARSVRRVTLSNERGLHARPISRLIETARRFRSRLIVRCGAQQANGSRMLEMLALAAPPGAELEFEAEGEDAEALTEALAALVASRFGEG